MLKFKKPLNTSILLGCITFVAFLCVTLSVVNFINYDRTLHRHYEKDITDIIEYVSANIDVDDLRECIETGQKSEKYHELQSFIDGIKENFDIDFLYIVIPQNTDEKDNMKNVIAAMTEYEKRHEPETRVELNGLTGTAYDSDTAAMYMVGMKSPGNVTFFEDKTVFGLHYTGVYPLIDSRGKAVALLCVDIASSDIKETVWRHTAMNIGLIVLMGAAFIFVFINWTRSHITEPIKTLEKNVVAFVSKNHGQSDKPISVLSDPNIHTDNEVESLSDAVIKMSTDMMQHVKNTTEMERELKKLRDKVNRQDINIRVDPLTGVKDSEIFDWYKGRLQYEIVSMDGTYYPQFAIVVVLVCDASRIGETYGRDCEDQYIKKVCKLLCSYFVHSPVFRIENEVFAAILEGDDYTNRDNLYDKMCAEYSDIEKDQSHEPWERLKVSANMALYDRAVDRTVDDVLKRAEDEIYSRNRNGI